MTAPSIAAADMPLAAPIQNFGNKHSEVAAQPQR